MKKLNVLVLGVIATLGLSSCLKDDPFDEAAQFELEKPLVEAYANENFDDPQLHEELGIRFEVLEPGDPSSYEYKLVQNPNDPNQRYVEAPDVVVKYTLRRLDNTVVEEDDNAEFSLGQVIFAWQYAFLPQQIDGQEITGLTPTGLKKGSKIRIVTPSRWAYRNGGSNGIPPNTPLAFDIEVLEIHPPEDAAD